MNKKAKKVMVASGIVGLFSGLWVNQAVLGLFAGLSLGWFVGFVTKNDV